jgi:hypothetical protein
VDDGTAGRVELDDPAYADRLHLLGNGVVAEAAAIAYLILFERIVGHPDATLAVVDGAQWAGTD